MSTIEEIIKSYNPKTINDNKFILRELIQSIVLIGLSRTDFFKKASFYGGTALRIFYNLNRYSEDLDFTLNEEDDNFSLEPYIESIVNVAESYGLDLEVSVKQKQIKTPVESAFAKLNTYQTFINLKLNEELTKLLHKDEVIKVKFEIDCHPSNGFTTESRWIDMPEFAQVVMLDGPSLFAGKINAVLFRKYKNTIKGRDFYDFLFYVRQGISPNLNYIKQELIDKGRIKDTDQFDIDVLKKLLIERFKEIDFDMVRKDVERFIIKNEDLSYYCQELFIQMVNKIK